MGTMRSNYTLRLFEAKAGSELRFEPERGMTLAKLKEKVQGSRNQVRGKGIVTVQHNNADHIIVRMLSDSSTPASARELAQLANKGPSTLEAWAKKRKGVEVVHHEPLVEVLPAQEPGRAQRRGDRIASREPEIGNVAAVNGHATAAVNAHAPKVEHAASDESEHEQHMLWRESYVTAQRTNPMGKHEERAEVAGAAVNAFREFFGLAD